MQNKYLFLFLANGVVNEEGFWLIDIKRTDKKILDDKNLIECHRKELVGDDSAKEILNAININLDNLTNELKKQNFILDKPPKGISFNIPLNLLEKIFDFWIDIYKDKEVWETCFGLLKIRQKVSLRHLINNKAIKGNTKKWAIEIEDLHNYKPKSFKASIENDPMWK